MFILNKYFILIYQIKSINTYISTPSFVTWLVKQILILILKLNIKLIKKHIMDKKIFTFLLLIHVKFPIIVLNIGGSL